MKVPSGTIGAIHLIIKTLSYAFLWHFFTKIFISKFWWRMDELRMKYQIIQVLFSTFKFCFQNSSSMRTSIRISSLPSCRFRVVVMGKPFDGAKISPKYFIVSSKNIFCWTKLRKNSASSVVPRVLSLPPSMMRGGQGVQVNSPDYLFCVFVSL